MAQPMRAECVGKLETSQSDVNIECVVVSFSKLYRELNGKDWLLSGIRETEVD